MPTKAAKKAPTRKQKARPRRAAATAQKKAPPRRVAAATKIKPKVRVRSVRSQIERGLSEITLKVPALITIAEMAAIGNYSKPTAVRILNRGDVRAYRPNGPGGVVLVHAESLARHIKKNSSGGAR